MGEERGGELYIRIEPADPDLGREQLARRLRALDEELTERLPGGVGDYDPDRQHVDVWLFDDALEAQARALIERHGFRVVQEEEVDID